MFNAYQKGFLIEELVCYQLHLHILCPLLKMFVMLECH